MYENKKLMQTEKERQDNEQLLNRNNELEHLLLQKTESLEES